MTKEEAEKSGMQAMEATKYREGPISVDNEAHPEFTEVKSTQFNITPLPKWSL